MKGRSSLCSKRENVTSEKNAAVNQHFRKITRRERRLINRIKEDRSGVRYSREGSEKTH